MKEKTEPFGLMGVFSHNDHINVDFLQEADKMAWNFTGHEVVNWLVRVLKVDPKFKYQVLIREVEDE